MDFKIVSNISTRNYEIRKIDDEYRSGVKKFLEFTYFQYINKNNSDYLHKHSFFEFLNLPQIVCKGILQGIIKEKRDYVKFDEFINGITILFDKYIPEDNSKLIDILFNMFKFSKLVKIEEKNNSNNQNFINIKTSSFGNNKNNIHNDENSPFNKIYNNEDIPTSKISIIEEFIIVKYLNIFLNNLLLKLFLISKNNKYEDYMSVCEEIKLVIKKVFGNKEEINYNDFKKIIENENELYFIIIYLFYCASPINENIINLIVNNKTSNFYKDETNLYEEDLDAVKIQSIRECGLKKSLREIEKMNSNSKILDLCSNVGKNTNNYLINLDKTESFVYENPNHKANTNKVIQNTLSLENLNFKKIFAPKISKKLSELELTKLNLKIETNKFERNFMIDNNENKILGKTTSINPQNYAFINTTTNLNNNINFQQNTTMNIINPTLFNNNQGTNSNNLNNINFSPITNRRSVFPENFISTPKKNFSQNSILNKDDKNQKISTIKNNNSYYNIIRNVNSSTQNNLNVSYSNSNLSSYSNIGSNMNTFSNNINLVNSSNLLNKNNNLHSSTKNSNNLSYNVDNINLNQTNNLGNIKNDWIVKIIKNLTNKISELHQERYRSSYFTIFYENNIKNSAESNSFYDDNYIEKNSLTEKNNENSGQSTKTHNYFIKKKKNFKQETLNEEINEKKESLEKKEFHLNKIQNSNQKYLQNKNHKIETNVNKFNENTIKENNINFNEKQEKYTEKKVNVINGGELDNYITRNNLVFKAEKEKKKKIYEIINPQKYSKCLGDFIGEFFLIFTYINLGNLELKTILNLKFSNIESGEDFMINGNVLYPVLIKQNQLNYRILFENDTERELFFKIYEENILKKEILKKYRINETIYKNRFVTISKGINTKKKMNVEIKTYIKSEIKKDKVLFELLEQKDLGLIINFFKNCSFPKIKYYENSEKIFLVYENYEENPILFYFMNPKSKISKDISKYSKILIELKMYKKIVKLIKFDEVKYFNRNNGADYDATKTNYLSNDNSDISDLNVARNNTSPDAPFKNQLSILK